MKPEDLAKSGSEFGEQSALFCWANLAETRKRFPHFYDAPRNGEKVGRCKMYSTNNNAGVSETTEQGRKTAAIRGARAKQIGLKPGVADIFTPLARRGFFGFYLELKIDPFHPANQRTGAKGQAIQPKRGTVSDEQKAFGSQVESDGYAWAVAEGWKEARDFLVWYLEG